MANILITTSSFGVDNHDIFNIIKASGLVYHLNPFGRKLTEIEVINLLVNYNPIGMIAGVEPLTKNALKKATNLKVISRCGIGIDSIDLNIAKELGIAITNTPNAPTVPVAELTLGLILSFLRRIYLSDASIRQGKWVRPMGNTLHSKTVGIIGCGRIGSYLAKLLSVFGCNVLGYDLLNKEGDHYTLCGLDELLFNSDIVSLHIPYITDNHYYINKDRLRKMKQGAILVNVARGGLIDESALYNDIVSGHLGGAVIDCFEDEPYHGILTELNNVLLTAHIGSYAKESRIMMEEQAIENLLFELRKNGEI